MSVPLSAAWPALVAVALLTLAVVLPALRRRANRFPYVPAQALFTPAEQAFLSVLDRAVGAEHRVFGKVRIADVARPKPGLDYGNHLRTLNRVAAKHFDYVVCRAYTLAMVCAVELNDRSHRAQHRQQRDAFVAGVCQTIGIPLLQVAAQRNYAIADVRTQFLAALASAPKRSKRARAMG